MKTATKEQQVAHQEYVREERKQSSQTMKLKCAIGVIAPLSAALAAPVAAGTCKGASKQRNGSAWKYDVAVSRVGCQQ
jgi:hypothetical protein